MLIRKISKSSKKVMPTFIVKICLLNRSKKLITYKSKKLITNWITRLMSVQLRRIVHQLNPRYSKKRKCLKTQVKKALESNLSLKDNKLYKSRSKVNKVKFYYHCKPNKEKACSRLWMTISCSMTLALPLKSSVL